MNTQPEALLLADWHKAMADEPKRNEAKRDKHRRTEIELRRLHEHLSNLKKGHTLLVEENFNLKDDKQELLEALKAADELIGMEPFEHVAQEAADAHKNIRAAIAKHGGAA